MRRPSIPDLAVILFVVVSIAPLVVLFLAPISALSVSFQPKLLFSSFTANLLIITLFIAAAAAILGILPVVLYSWIVSRTDVVGKRFFDSFPVYNRTIPDFVKAIGFVILFNPVNGLMNQLFMPLFHHSIFNVYTTWGVVFGLVVGGVGANYLFVSGTVQNLDPALEEASRTSGHSILRTFASVSLPALRQIVFITIIWQFMTGLVDFNYPIVMGPPGNFATLTTAILLDITEKEPPNYGGAATLGIIFVILAMGTFTAYQFFTRKRFMFRAVGGRVSQATLHQLHGLGRWAASAYCFSFVVLGFFLPFAAVLWLAVTVPGRFFVFSGWANFARGLTIPNLQQGFVNSVLLGIIVVLVSIPFVILIAYAIFRTHRVSRLAEYLVILPKGIPDIVLSLGIFLMFLTVPVLNLLYGTIVPFVLAIVIASAPNQILILSGNMVQIGDELEEASRVGGASWTRTLTRVISPLAIKAIINAMQLTFVDSAQALGAVVLLVTPNFYVYITLLLDSYTNGEIPLNGIAAASVLLTVFLAFCVGLIKLTGRFVGRERRSSRVTRPARTAAEAEGGPIPIISRQDALRREGEKRT